MNRREYLALFGGGSLVGVAGCSADDGSDDNRTTTATGAATTTESVGTTTTTETTQQTTRATTEEAEETTEETTEEAEETTESEENGPAVIEFAAPEATRDSLTFRGEVRLRDSEWASIWFKHRRVPDGRWTISEKFIVEENRTVEHVVPGLDPKGLYEYKYQVSRDTGESEFQTDAQYVTLDAPSDGDEAGPASSAPHDMADGFVDPAPWLDDSTPVVKVTDLNTAQLRRACGADHPRVVVFETSGVVDLNGGGFTITGDECWIAGQTAPSPGITFVRGDVTIDADDCVVQHLRSRPGDAGKTGTWQNGAFDVAPGSENVVLDHLSATWSIDENLSIGYPDTGQVTVSNCLVAQALYDSLHPKGPHGYGSIASPQGSEETAHLGNVWALNSARNPRSGPKGFYGNCLSFYFERAAYLDRGAENAFIGHAFVDPAGETDGCIQDGYVYTEDCLTEPDGVPLLGNVQGELDEPPLMPDTFESIPGAQTEAAALKHVGARPADRAAVDASIVQRIRERDGRYIDSQTEVGGYPDLSENTRELSVPTDGLRSWLRERALAVEP